MESKEPSSDTELEALIADQVQTGEKPRQQVYYSKPATSKEQAPVFSGGGHHLLTSAKAQDTFQRFGVDGLKTLVLQELVQLDFPDLQREIYELAKLPQPEVRRLLRAVKLMAAQWMEDTRQPMDVQTKATAIFEWIPTFKTSPLPPAPKTFEDDMLSLNFNVARDNPLPPPLSERPAVGKGELPQKVVLMTDVQGDWPRLQRLLQTHRLAAQQAGKWVWTGGDAYLVLAGDLLNGSPFSAWRHRVGQESLLVVQVLRDLMAQGRVVLLPAQYDWEVASHSLFLHPRWNARNHLALHAQAMITTLSLLEQTAWSDPEHPYSAWNPTEFGFTLKGELPLTVANQAGKPDTDALVALYRHMVSLFAATPPASLDDLNRLIRDHLPHHHQLDLLAATEARVQLLRELLNQTELIDFLRASGQAEQQWSLGSQTVTLSHVTMRPEKAARLAAAKAGQWLTPSLTDLIRTSPFLQRKGLPAAKILAALPGDLSAADAIAGDPDLLFNSLTQNKTLKAFCEATGLKPDRPFFRKGWELFQNALRDEDPTGLAGLTWQAPPSEERPLRKIGDLDERAQQAYADKFWHDTFPDWPAPHVTLMGQGAVSMEGPGVRVALQLDGSVALFADDQNQIHLPIRHSAVIERVGNRA